MKTYKQKRRQNVNPKASLQAQVQRMSQASAIVSMSFQRYLTFRRSLFSVQVAELVFLSPVITVSTNALNRVADCSREDPCQTLKVPPLDRLASPLNLDGGGMS